jgi:hypothetical protein
LSYDYEESYDRETVNNSRILMVIFGIFAVFVESFCYYLLRPILVKVLDAFGQNAIRTEPSSIYAHVLSLYGMTSLYVDGATAVIIIGTLIFAVILPAYRWEGGEYESDTYGY